MNLFNCKLSKIISNYPFIYCNTFAPPYLTFPPPCSGPVTMVGRGLSQKIETRLLFALIRLCSATITVIVLNIRARAETSVTRKNRQKSTKVAQK